MIFDGRYGMPDIVDSVSRPEGRAQWDPALEDSQLIKEYSKNLVVFRYVVKIPVFMMNNREFVEKKLIFRLDDCVYTYSTSVDDSFYPQTSGGLTRGSTIFSGSRIKREGQNIVIRSATQIDFKVPVPTFFIGGKIADGTAEFRKAIMRRLDAKLGSA